MLRNRKIIKDFKKAAEEMAYKMELVVDIVGPIGTSSMAEELDVILQMIRTESYKLDAILTEIENHCPGEVRQMARDKAKAMRKASLAKSIDFSTTLDVAMEKSADDMAELFTKYDFDDMEVSGKTVNKTKESFLNLFKDKCNSCEHRVYCPIKDTCEDCSEYVASKDDEEYEEYEEISDTEETDETGGNLDSFGIFGFELL